MHSQAGPPGPHYLPTREALLCGRLAAKIARQPSGKGRVPMRIAYDAAFVALALLAAQSAIAPMAVRAQHVARARQLLAQYDIKLQAQGKRFVLVFECGTRVVLSENTASPETRLGAHRARVRKTA